MSQSLTKKENYEPAFKIGWLIDYIKLMERKKNTDTRPKLTINIPEETYVCLKCDPEDRNCQLCIAAKKEEEYLRNERWTALQVGLMFSWK